jgi:hypothetical protein
MKTMLSVLLVSCIASQAFAVHGVVAVRRTPFRPFVGLVPIRASVRAPYVAPFAAPYYYGAPFRSRFVAPYYAGFSGYSAPLIIQQPAYSVPPAYSAYSSYSSYGAPAYTAPAYSAYTAPPALQYQTQRLEVDAGVQAYVLPDGRTVLPDGRIILP